MQFSKDGEGLSGKAYFLFLACILLPLPVTQFACSAGLKDMNKEDDLVNETWQKNPLLELWVWALHY